jgi:CheY-like chemotaxis protein
MIPSKHPRILIVEDEPSIRNVLARGLRTFGFEVVEADDASVAVELIRKNGITVVLLDLLMPKVDGVDVLTHLERSPEHTPKIIVITNLSQDEALEKIGSHHVDGIMTKASSSLQQIIDAVAAYGEPKGGVKQK